MSHEEQNAGSEEQVVIRNANEDAPVDMYQHQEPSPTDIVISLPQNEEQPAEEPQQEAPTIEAPVVEEKIEPVVETPVQEAPPVVIDDAKIFEILKERTGLEVSDFEQLKPKEEKKLPAEVEKFLEFTSETGNTSYQDFLETQKEWDKEDADVVIKKGLALKNPLLSKEDIDFLFEDTYGTDEFDPEDSDDARKIRSREINKKVELQSALSLLEQQKEKYKVVRGADENVPQQFKEAKAFYDQYLEQEEQGKKVGEALRNEFVGETEKIFSEGFEGFKSTIDGKDYQIKPQDLNATKAEQLDITNFNKRFFDEQTGKLKDPVGYHKALYFGMNADKVAQHYFNLGKASQAESDDAEGKNISVAQNTNMPPHAHSEFSVRVVK